MKPYARIRPYGCATVMRIQYLPNSFNARPCLPPRAAAGQYGRTLVACDFVDAANPDAPLVVLFHGLEAAAATITPLN